MAYITLNRQIARLCRYEQCHEITFLSEVVSNEVGVKMLAKTWKWETFSIRSCHLYASRHTVQLFNTQPHPTLPHFYYRLIKTFYYANYYRKFKRQLFLHFAFLWTMVFLALIFVLAIFFLFFWRNHDGFSEIRVHFWTF